MFITEKEKTKKYFEHVVGGLVMHDSLHQYAVFLIAKVSVKYSHTHSQYVRDVCNHL